MVSVEPRIPFDRSGVRWLVAGSVALAFASLWLSFRFPIAPPDIVWQANGPRLLAAAIVGWGFAVVGATARRRALHEAYVFGLSIGGGCGFAIGLKLGGGPLVAAACGVLGAALGWGLVRSADSTHYASNIWLAIVLAAVLVAAVPGYYAASSELAGFGGAALWWFGDVSRASGTGTLLAGLLAVAATSVVVLRPQSPIGAALLFGLALGVGGLVAFVGWIAPWLSRRAGSSIERSHVIHSGLVGAALLMAADALPRLLIGGYASPLNVSIAIVAVPALLWWNRSRLRKGRPGHCPRWFDALEASVLVAGTAAVFYVAVAVVQYARSAT